MIILEAYAFLIDLLFPLWCGWAFIIIYNEILSNRKHPKE